MRRLLLVLTLVVGACAGATRDANAVVRRADVSGPRVLGVIAHPDDETAFAATLYKITRLLDGACDLVVITNGEGGFKYSTLAEPLYGVELTDEGIGRSALPAIRKRELAESARILGVRSLVFLDQRDHRYTTDVNEVLGPGARVWDLELVRRRLGEVLARGDYEFVLALAPTPETHAHHKAATALAAEAVLALPEATRPVMLVAQTRDAQDASVLAFAPEEAGVPVGPFVLDRTQRFGFQDKLDYRIVVNWAIAAHKSQGTMQLAVNKGEREEFFVFGDRRIEASRKAATLFESLRGNPFETRTYGESAGTNAVTPR